VGQGPVLQEPSSLEGEVRSRFAVWGRGGRARRRVRRRAGVSIVWGGDRRKDWIGVWFGVRELGSLE
jgi:hypothetical protein